MTIEKIDMGVTVAILLAASALIAGVLGASATFM